ncbi:MAG: hypothetical protein R3D98_03145 [Candidatus Krumholzibacteriia bacterium]
MTARDPIGDAIGELDREITPRRDLWPGIAGRLDTASPASRRSPHVSGWWLAAAAVLVLTLWPRLHVDAPPSPTGGPELTRLDAAYADVRAGLVALVEDRCERLPTTACVPLLDGLAVLDRTVSGLSTALAHLPPDAPQRPALVASYEQTLALARDLSGRVAQL